MTQQEITLLNLGNSLDDLANIDPRGYGVCKLLYNASKEYTGLPLCLNSAQKLVETVKENDRIFIMTGFVLLPFNKAETDGAVGSFLLAKALKTAFGAKPVIICPEDCANGFLALSKAFDYDIDIEVFTKEKEKAEECAEKLIKIYNPSAVISIECPGENENGIYHSARGIDVTAVEAKQDILFEKLKNSGILNIAIGDLGNEIGMGTIENQIKSKIPLGDKICVRTKADNIITATVSDWGCYALIAMLAYIVENSDVMHDAVIEKKALKVAAEGGLVDMYGELIPAIDGIGEELICPIVTVMKQLVISSLSLKETCKPHFDEIIKLGSFEHPVN